MAIEKEKFFEIINKVSKSEDLNKDNLLKKIVSESKEIDLKVYNACSGLKDNVLPNKTFMIQDLDKIAGYTLLHLAVECNSVPIVKLLLKKKVKVDEQMSGDVNSKFTALHIAALRGHKEIVQLLLNNNADPSLKDSRGRTPRDIVGDVEGKKAIIGMLEAASSLTRDNENTKASVVERVRVLEKRQKENNNENNINKVDDALEGEQAIREIEQTYLHNQHPEQYTTYNEERTFLNKSSSEDSGICFYADKSEALSQSILEDGKDIYAQDENGYTPLHHAAANGDVKNAKSLIDNGAGVNAQDKDGVTPLHHAAANGDVKNAKSLIDNGADVDARNRDKHTPLHYAAVHGYVEIVKYLIDNRANVNAQDEDGHIPLHFAVKYDNKELANLLIKHGADRSLINDEDLIDKLNSMCDQPSEVVPSTFSHSKTHNATKTTEETEKVKKRKVKLKKLCAQLKEENQSLKQKIQDLESEKATLNSELEENENKHSKIKVLLKKAQKELTESKSCIAGHETKLKEFNKENQSLKQKIKDMENENTTLNSELSKTKANKVLLEKTEKGQLSFLKIASVNFAIMLTVGVAFSIAFQLPILLMIATSVMSSLIVGGVTYALSPQPTELKEVSIQGLMQHDVYKT
ncbi:ankyrin repeat domain-containing protein [Wolbachia endosymbiont (group B) of Longitarsus flavicornis]|uniref:ankyrin repeat domain-containing protein n=1 Tax=Wolbachia endosymbiont (group B) of Longitarsus flavicornis TaxID=3066135 RepID=UPI00333EB13A